MKVAIITEGGHGIGFGHLTRCLSLTHELTREGSDVYILINNDFRVKQMMRLNDSVFFYDQVDMIWDFFLKERSCFDVCIVDSYLLQRADYNRIKNSCRLLVCFDDDHRIAYPHGILINAAWRADKIGYDEVNHLCLLGPDYITVRPAFRHCSRNHIREEIERALIILGGFDAHHLIPRVQKLLLSNANKNLKIDVIWGDRADADESCLATKCSRVNYHFGLNDEEISTIMLSADIAISACGQTLYELARTGTPTIGIGVAENQRLNISGWSDCGFLQFAGWFNAENLEKKLIYHMRSLGEIDKRQHLAMIGQKFVDGLGVQRIVGAIRRKLDDV
ncbi:MAG: hypothetical protein EOM23_01345 [Candidatus Moranbacteria bacterium]|nr:hypothetical protein [Candidatus Moranbacteria bacterium]